MCDDAILALWQTIFAFHLNGKITKLLIYPPLLLDPFVLYQGTVHIGNKCFIIEQLFSIDVVCQMIPKIHVCGVTFQNCVLLFHFIPLPLKYLGDVNHKKAPQVNSKCCSDRKLWAL